MTEQLSTAQHIEMYYFTSQVIVMMENSSKLAEMCLYDYNFYPLVLDLQCVSVKSNPFLNKCSDSQNINTAVNDLKYI